MEPNRGTLKEMIEDGKFVWPAWRKPSEGMPDEFRNALSEIAKTQLQILFNPEGDFYVPPFYDWFEYEHRLLNDHDRKKRVQLGYDLAQMCRNDLGFSPDATVTEAMTSRASGSYKPEMLKLPIESWNDACVYLYLFHRALGASLIQFFGNKLIPYSCWCFQVYFDFALEDWPVKISQRDLTRVKRMIEAGEREAIQASVRKWFPYALDFFGEPDSPAEARLLELGVKTRTNQMVRQYFIDTVMQELKGLGLDSIEPYQGKSRSYPQGAWREYQEKFELPRGCYPFFWTEAEDMPADAKETFLKLITMQLTREGGGGPDKKGVGATRNVRVEYPTLEQFLHGVQISGDESCHMYGLASVAKSLGGDPYPIVRKSRSAKMEERSQVRELELFRNPKAYGSWIAHNVRRIFSERAGGYASIASLGSTYLPWAIWNARNFLDEGITHSRDSAENLKALDPGQRRDVQQRFNELYPWGLDMFGSNDSENNRTYIKWGVKTLTNRECRALWLLSLTEDAEFAGLQMPEDLYQGARGRYDD